MGADGVEGKEQELVKFCESLHDYCLFISRIDSFIYFTPNMRLMSNRYDRQANLWISGPNPVKADYLNKFSNAWTQYIEEATGEAVTVLTNVILVLLAIFALLQIEGQTFAELRTNVVISEVRFETTMKSLLCSRWFVIGSVVN